MIPSEGWNWTDEEMAKLLPQARAQIKAGKLPAGPVRKADEYGYPRPQEEPCRVCGRALGESEHWFRLHWYARKIPAARLRPVLHGACYSAWLIAIGGGGEGINLTQFYSPRAPVLAAKGGHIP